MGTERQFDLQDRLMSFAVRIIRLTDPMVGTRAANHLAGQLLRSGTSPHLNYGEALAAESRRDFIHKMSICLKELRESERALALIHETALTDALSETAALRSEADELIRIFAASIRTARSKDLRNEAELYRCGWDSSANEN